MDAELGFDDFKVAEGFADFSFEDYALETEVKSEDLIRLPSELDQFEEQEASALQICCDEASNANPEIVCDVLEKEGDSNRAEISSDSPETCLALNQTYQKLIVESLNKLQIILNKNHMMQVKLEEERKANEAKKKGMGKSIKHKKPINLLAAPYFRDVKGRIPPDNEDTKMKRKNRDVDAYLGPPKIWSQNEYEKLLRGVKSNVLTITLEPYRTKRDFLKNKLQTDLSEEEERSVLHEIFKIEDEVNMVKQVSLDDYLKIHKDKIDWLAVSASYMEGGRSADQCECVWYNYLDPCINKEKFTPEEDAKLSSIAKKFTFRYWDAIAKILATNRSAIQCFERYQSTLNTDILKKYWTEEEDKRLLYIVNTFKVGNTIPWHKVVLYMDGRTRLQITNRWIRNLEPGNKRTPWTEAEDTILYAGVKKFGYQWKKIKDFLPGRSNYICRERYMNNLVPGLKIGEWSPDEDRQLIQLIHKYGFGKWSKIYVHLPGRTDNMCLRRAQRLQTHHPSWFKSKRKACKTNNKNSEQNIDDPGRADEPQYPLTASNTCNHWNRRLSTIRSTAEKNLICVLKKILGRDDIEDVDTINLSEANNKLLHDIRDELLKNDEQIKSTEWKPRYGIYSGKKKRKRNRYFDSTDETEEFTDEDDPNIGLDDSLETDYNESEDDGVIEDDNDGIADDTDTENVGIVKKEKSEEHDFIAKVLDSLMMPALIMKQKGGSVHKTVALSSRIGAERKVLKAYIFKSFKCHQTLLPDETVDSDDPEKFKFLNVDYAVSVPRIIHFFVLPPVDANQFPVISANQANITGMEIMFATRISLIQSACFVQRNKSLLVSVSSDISSKSDVKCAFCLKQSQETQDDESPSQNAHIIEMRKDLLVVDGALKKAIAYELEDDGEMPETCMCDTVHNMRERVTLLRKRFLSLFLWPGLLGNLPPSEEQKINLFKNKRKERKQAIPTQNQVKRKRKPPKRNLRKTPPTQVHQEKETNSDIANPQRKRKYTRKKKADISEVPIRKSTRIRPPNTQMAGYVA